MDIKPIIKGVVAKNCHPDGCKQEVLNQISQVKKLPSIANGPKKVLVLGASSGLGLASRISLAFGSNADTIGLSYERPPSDEQTGTAGWHNNVAFEQAASEHGLIAKDFIADAFSADTKQNVIDYIKTKFGGEVDCIIYSLAAGVRPKPDGSGMWKSSLKAIGEPFTGNFINIEHQAMIGVTLPVASEQEIEDTVKVMGGEDWQEWISELSQAGVLAKGVKTVAYSYIGSDITYPVYFGGTLGRAKQHLHTTADQLNDALTALGGEAYAATCKSTVSKAAVFIPGLSSYMLALAKLLKQRGEYETCAEHMHRLMTDFLYHPDGALTDDQRLLRPDNRELNPEVQDQVKTMMTHITPENFTSPNVGDYEGFIKEFMCINGFGVNKN
ncbi:enoyl-ACP reductase FabV [Vibrio sp. VB16]|uniref:enoyl-ACP reductase FabV n=1 Tax=Vibrio sp. VB16 TaxID=2785746 RepID=UPI00189F924A|nr:enoyl-ACP reductase FabV [Vibrio sp. VB16]UGA53669.1 trans-2-enoyl-CoA reductase family protein [Vibrio sp. VB16]